jgi:hypothetical protein
MKFNAWKVFGQDPEPSFFLQFLACAWNIPFMIAQL